MSEKQYLQGSVEWITFVSMLESMHKLWPTVGMQDVTVDRVALPQAHLCMLTRASVVARHTPVFLSLNLSSSTGANDFAEL